MKKIIFLVLLFNQLVFAQDETIKTKAFTTKHQFFINLNYPHNFGENFLSKANSPNFSGIGIQYNSIKLYDFKVGIAYDFMQYRLTDHALGANLDFTNSNSLTLKIQYEYNLHPKWNLEPYIGIGKVLIQQRANGAGYGHFFGTSYCFGINVTQQLSKTFSVYSGLNYNYGSYEVKTAKEFENYFQNSNQIQFALGIIFTIPKKKP